MLDKGGQLPWMQKMGNMDVSMDNKTLIVRDT